jgi:hypothetical protein
VAQKQANLVQTSISTNPVDNLLKERSDLLKYGSNARLLLVLQIRQTIDDIDTVAATALTDDPADKKCDLVYIDTERGVVIIAQAYEATVKKAAAKEQKASDLNTAVSWLLSRPLEELPTVLKGAAKDLRESLQSGVIQHIYIWFLHNLAESKNVKEELKTVEHTAKNAMATHFPTIKVDDIIAVEVGSETQTEWYNEHQTPILVTDTFDLIVAGGYTASGKDWKAYSTTVPTSWIHTIYKTHQAKLFSANLRDYLGSKPNDKNINNGIKTTASDDGPHFWAFNNGLTALVNSIKVTPKEKEGKIHLKISGLSIVNGAQTTGAIGSLPAPPSHSEVQIRFIECSSPETITNIIVYNNSQNRLEVADFRSNDAVQKRLKAEFAKIQDSSYSGRRGGNEDIVKRPKNLLPSDACVQALAIMHQQPIVAYNQKSQVWTDDSLYSRFFSEQTHADHIVFAYSLLRSVEGAKLTLKKKVPDKLTDREKAQLDYFSQRGSTFMLAAGIAGCLETILGKSVPNRFRVSFGPKVSPALAQANWTSVISVFLPFVKQLEPAIENVLRDEKTVSDSLSAFEDVVESVKTYHKTLFAEFSKKVITRT